MFWYPIEIDGSAVSSLYDSCLIKSLVTSAIQSFKIRYAVFYEISDNKS